MRSSGEVGSFSTLGLINDDIAQSYMTHIRQRLSGILKTRGWYVHHLKEFYPRSMSLLGLNVGKGQEICIRFRIPGNKHQFLPFPEVMCTVLHELVHCVYSRHDKKFWEMYAALVVECETLEVELVKKGLPLYPKHVPLVGSISSCDTVTPGPGRKKTACKKLLMTRENPTSLLRETHLTNELTAASGSSSTSEIFPSSSGHRLGGRATPPPTSEEGRRSLLASKARERHEAHLQKISYAQSQERFWASESTPDIFSFEWDNGHQEECAEGPKWRCWGCGYINKGSQSPELYYPCAMYADVEEEEEELLSEDVKLLRGKNEGQACRITSSSSFQSGSLPQLSNKTSEGLDSSRYRSTNSSSSTLSLLTKDPWGGTGEEDKLSLPLSPHKALKEKSVENDSSMGNTKKERNNRTNQNIFIKRFRAEHSPAIIENFDRPPNRRRTTSLPVVEVLSEEEIEEIYGRFETLEIIHVAED